MAVDFKTRKYEKYVATVIIVDTSLGLGYGGFFYYETTNGIIQNTEDLENTILGLENKNIALADTLQKEQQKNKSFETQIGEIVGTVGKLDKLSKTDKELLQKYSKVYFLNENYLPGSLLEIPKEYLLQKERTLRIHSKVLPYLEEMIKALEENQTPIEVVSSYRSFGEQSSLKNNYTVIYGSGANTFSADQGYSEHQLGTAIDLTTVKLGANFTEFSDTKAYEWLVKNAYKYGFVLSYPEGNSYYQYEPWHFRFVGKSLANRLHEERQYFYDMSQRAIDAYLINIFD